MSEVVFTATCTSSKTSHIQEIMHTEDLNTIFLEIEDILQNPLFSSARFSSNGTGDSIGHEFPVDILLNAQIDIYAETVNGKPVRRETAKHLHSAQHQLKQIADSNSDVHLYVTNN